jgi:hypothetical protein
MFPTFPVLQRTRDWLYLPAVSLQIWVFESVLLDIAIKVREREIVFLFLSRIEN